MQRIHEKWFNEAPAAFHDWAGSWRRRIADEGGSAEQRRQIMRAANPAFIPRNHLVEEAITHAVGAEDFGPFERLIAVLSRPYDDQPDARQSDVRNH